MRERELTLTTLFDSFQAISFTFIEVGHDANTEIVELARPADIKSCDKPGNKELREGKNIREVHRTDALVHELRKVTDRYRQQKVIHHEDHNGGDDEFRFRDQQQLEFVHASDVFPYVVCQWGGGRFRGFFYRDNILRHLVSFESSSNTYPHPRPRVSNETGER